MHLYKTTKGNLLRFKNQSYLINGEWDELVNQPGLYDYFLAEIETAQSIEESEAANYISNHILAPIESQEVWAAGVTYSRSREARMEESKDSGAADCYDRVYEAERPELFFKSLPHRVVGPGGEVNIRKDSTWNVPEPELTLFINSTGDIQAYTIGNDMSSRSIEGENPLYLPQAKVYEKSASIGPCLYILPEPIPHDTKISLVISRDGKTMYEDSTPISRMKRTLPELAEYLYQEMDFPTGAYLMTGTCLVPPKILHCKKEI